MYGHKVSGGRSHWKGDYVDGAATPLYPFGFGLGYTTFRISDLSVTPDLATWNGEVTVSASVTNTGDRDGDEVLQLYVRDPVASVTRPVLELRDSPGSSSPRGTQCDVTFTLPVGPARVLQPRPGVRGRAGSDRRPGRDLVGRPGGGRIVHRDAGDRRENGRQAV